jgi:hypothetical protein
VTHAAEDQETARWQLLIGYGTLWACSCGIRLALSDGSSDGLWQSPMMSQTG